LSDTQTSEQRSGKPVFRHPALLIHEDAVHDGDLPGGAAEREHRDPQPDRKRLCERGMRDASPGREFHCRIRRRHAITVVALGWTEGQLWVSWVASRHQR